MQAADVYVLLYTGNCVILASAVWSQHARNLLVINCHLSSGSYRFRDITSQSRKLLHPSLSLPPRSTNFAVWMLRPRATLRENRMILTSVVLSQYVASQTDDRQHHDNSRTLECNCNVRLKIYGRWCRSICCIDAPIKWLHLNRRYSGVWTSGFYPNFAICNAT